MKTELILQILWSIGLFISLYVVATTNALYNHFDIAGINQFKEPFYLANELIFFMIISMLVVSIILRLSKKKIPLFIHKLSYLSIIIISIVFMLRFFPCLYKASSPYTLESVLTQSFLCPSYSHRSTINQIMFLIPSILLYFISKPKTYKKI